MAKVYISSTYSDLKEYREKVYHALRKLGCDAIAMEDYVAIDQRPLDKSLQDVAACDLYVGIFAWRYGYIPDRDNPDQNSITELEYRKAKELGKTCLIFLLDEKAKWDREWMDDLTHEGGEGKRIAELRQELGKERVVSRFKTPDDLALAVNAAVSNWMVDTHLKGKTAPTASPPIPQPREVTHHVFLVYASPDEKFASKLAAQLKDGGRRLLLSPRALFAEEADDFQELEKILCQCHTAAVVLSDTTLIRMKEHREQTRRILDILESRTGQVIALCRTADGPERARDWGFSQVYDVSTWEPDSGPAPIELISQIDRAIAVGCPPGGTRTIGVPFVVAAMTHDEAVELHEHPEYLVQELGGRTYEQFQALQDSLGQLLSHVTSTDRYRDYRQFQTLKEALELHAAPSVAQRYGTTREGWKPFAGSQGTISMVIEDMVETLNKAPTPQLGGRRIKAQYYSFDALVRKEKELCDVYDEIAQTGCVVVIDELSMFHHRVRAAFVESLLLNSKSAAMVTISPFDPYGLPPNWVLESELRTRVLAVAFKRFDRDYNPQYEFGIGSEHRLKRWLHQSVPEEVHTLCEPRPDSRRLDEWLQEVQQEVGTTSSSELPSLV